MAVEQLTDEELARRGGEGDREAFAALYGRYFQRIYDFALRLTRNADDAADVAQATFLKAYQSLAGRDPDASLKSWLFTIAHHDALDRLRRRRRASPDAEVEDEALAVADPSRLADPLDEARRQELAKIVWQAARTLNTRDYALLDLHVRQGLDAGEIAAVLGKRREAVHTMLSRLRDSFRAAFRTLVVITTGRRRCEELAAIAGPLELSPAVRRRVQQHIDACETCRESDRRAAAIIAEDWLAALAPVPALPGLQGTILSRVLDGSSRREGPRQGWQAFLSRRRLVAAAGGLLAAILLVLAIVWAAGAFDGGAALRDPEDVHSTSHEIGVPSEDPTVVLEWTPVGGVLGYSVLWSTGPDALPDTTRDLSPDASATTRTLPPGAWYFSLRTEGKDGDWTSTVHLGPFVVIQSAVPSTPSPTSAPSPTDTAGFAPTATVAVAPATPTQPQPPTATEPPPLTPTPTQPFPPH